MDLKNRLRNIETDRRNSLAGPRESPAKQPRAFAETILAAAEHHCGNVLLRPTRSHLKWAVHSSEQPSEAKRDGYCRIGLIFDGVAQCLLKGTGGLGGAVDGFAIEVLGGILYFTGLFLGLSNSTVEFSARGGGV